MAESNELFTEVAKIHDEVQDLRALTEALVRDSRAREAIIEAFERDPALAAIYRLVDGQRSQGEIQRALAEQGLSGVSQASVSRKLDTLAGDLDLVVLLRQISTGKVYRRSALGRVLKIDRAVDKGEFESA
jgi:DNA-binding transcriptional ArsR family regulator